MTDPRTLAPTRTDRPGTSRDPAGRRSAGRRRVFLVIALVCLVALGGYIVVRKQHDGAADAAASADEGSRARLDADAVLAEPHLVVRTTEPGPSYGKLALVPVTDPRGPRAIVDVICERVAAAPSGAICLQKVPGLLAAYRAMFLDARMRPIGTQDLGGVPSRARMSGDGSYAASTVFVSGHAYTDAQFSTETLITDMRTQESLGNLETWRTVRDGADVAPTDRNFWGVSFVGDGPMFFATLGSGGRRYLVEGDISTRSVTVLGPEGACPSVSPDATTVVYKQQDPESHNDHFVARDIATGRTTRLSEGRLVDDQVAWADDHTVLYAVGKGVASTVDFDIWSAPVDGGPASLLMADAASPSVVIPQG